MNDPIRPNLCYDVKLFIGDKWVLNSSHKNKESAVINAEVYGKSKKVPARVYYGNETVWEKI